MTNLATNAATRRTAVLPGAFQQYRTVVVDALRRGLEDAHTGVCGMLRFHMGWSDAHGNAIEGREGKALRPTLCLFACEATGGVLANAVPAAVALEYIHNFSLIHDDIQDRDETRHGRATLYYQWGMPKALVAGNFLRVVADGAVQDLVDSGLNHRLALEVAEVLTESYLEMIEGQVMDLDFEGRQDVTVKQYMEMISKKTGALFRCSVDLGAMIGSRDRETLSAFHEFGRALGYVFQIRDDILGVWGEPEATGKPVHADIRRRKNSFPVVHAMSQAGGEDRRSLRAIYEGADDVTDDEVASVLQIMDRTGTQRFAHDTAAEFKDQALDAIAAVELPERTRGDLEQLADFLLIREH